MSTPALASPLSARTERMFRVTTTLSVILLAVMAAVLSYSGLKSLAVDAQINPQLAWVFPLVVDGLTFVGSIGVVYAVLANISAWYPWLLTLLGVTISITGNIAVSPPDVVSRMVHATPPLVLALSLEALLRVYRARAHRSPHLEMVGGEKAVRSEFEHQKTNPPLWTYTETPPVTPEAVPEAPTPTETPPVTPEAVPEAAVASNGVERPVMAVDEGGDISPPVEDELGEGNSSTEVSPSVAVEPAVRSINSHATGTLTTRQKVRQLLRDDSDITGAEVARRLHIDDSHARKLLRQLRDDIASDDDRNELFA